MPNNANKRNKECVNQYGRKGLDDIDNGMSREKLFSDNRPNEYELANLKQE